MYRSAHARTRLSGPIFNLAILGFVWGGGREGVTADVEPICVVSVPPSRRAGKSFFPFSNFTGRRRSSCALLHHFPLCSETVKPLLLLLRLLKLVCLLAVRMFCLSEARRHGYRIVLVQQMALVVATLSCDSITDTG
jgi:hypothetical protein